ncbi:MAG: serine/threonine protein kinase [Phycisphaerales bacterium]|nr:serine/threonine protein kinase [Phycisphaerales bacterium]
MTQSLQDAEKAAFERAAGLCAADRAAFLRDLHRTDPTLAAEIESLLSHHDQADCILDSAPITWSGSAPAGFSMTDELDLHLPAKLGSYTLLRIIGSGGMGVVYEAEQSSPRRHVAVKLIRPEVASSSMLRRFEHEAEALGALSHPGIARVYESGRAALDGHPRAFIAMELVTGLSIVEHARASRLSQAERLELIAEVCDAIESAHRRGVIHRDLKPANIAIGQDGHPRILDFGVARLSGDNAATMMTAAGQIVGTLAYMSPEQATGDGSKIDSRSDVYSVGAVLFELLYGTPPVPISELSLQAALSAIQNAPSRIPKQQASAGRDVEAIVLRALEKDPARRYQHASDLADDLRRVLRNEPVSARRPTAVYQLTQFCRRHRELSAAVVLAIVIMCIAIVVISRALVRAERALADSKRSAKDAIAARDDAVIQGAAAERSAERYRSLNGFVQKLLGSVRPQVALGKDTSLLRSLVEASENDLGSLVDQPVALADAHHLLSQIYRDLGEFARAEEHGNDALDLYVRHLGENSETSARVMNDLGALYRGSLRRFDKAESLLQRAEKVFVGLQGEDGEETLRTRSGLALLYLDTAQYTKAEPLLRRIREQREHTLGPSDLGTLKAMHNHAGALGMIGRDAEAEAVSRVVYESRLGQLGEKHPETITSMVALSSLLRVLGRPDESLPLIEKGVELRTELLGESHQHAIVARGQLAQTLRDLGRLDEASREAEKTVTLGRSVLGASHLDTLQGRCIALELRAMQGNCEGALAEAQEISEQFGASMGQNAAFSLLAADISRGYALSCVGDDQAAVELLSHTYEQLRATVGQHHRTTRRAAASLAWVHESRSRPVEAGQWRARSAAPTQ